MVGDWLAASATSVETSNILLVEIGVLVLSVYRLKNLLIDVSGVAVSLFLSDTRESSFMTLPRGDSDWWIVVSKPPPPWVVISSCCPPPNRFSSTKQLELYPPVVVVVAHRASAAWLELRAENSGILILNNKL